MGDSERRVSGGGSMSQTMTSERGQRTEAKTYKNYIGGRWVESKSGRTFTSTNPAHKDEVLGVMQASTAEDVNAAIEAAQNAFSGWRHTPAIATMLVEFFELPGLPGGVLNLVTGSGSDVGDVLVRDPRVQGISFTGSTAAGKHIAEIAGRNLKRLGLELGGKNAIVVLDDADLPLAVDGALWAAFGTSGQRCTAASRLIVDKKVEKDFTDQLQERAAKMKVGDGLQPDTDMGPVINEAALKKVHEYTDIGKKEHARLVHGGDFAGSDGWFYRPTIFADGRKDMRMAQEEIFGPSTLVLPVSDLDEALDVANSTQYGLSMSIYTNDLRKAFHAMEEMQSGIVYVNAPTIGAEIQLPFGGVKNTGNGHREAGTVALDEFTEWKTIYVDYSGRLQRAQIDTGE